MALADLRIGVIGFGLRGSLVTHAHQPGHGSVVVALYLAPALEEPEMNRTTTLGLALILALSGLSVAGWQVTQTAQPVDAQSDEVRLIAGGVYAVASAGPNNADNFIAGASCDDSAQSGLAPLFLDAYRVALYGDDGALVDWVATGPGVVLGVVGTIVECQFPFSVATMPSQRFAQFVVSENINLDPNAVRATYSGPDIDRLARGERGFLITAPGLVQ